MTDSSTLVLSSKKLKIVTDTRLVKWNTARVIEPKLEGIKFFEGYESINKDIYDIYVHLTNYTRNNYAGKANINYNSDLYNSLVKHLDNMIEFQTLVDSEDPAIDLKAEAKARFDNENIGNTLSVQPIEIQRINLLLDYAAPIRILFNNLVSLSDPRDTPMTIELMSEIKEVLMNKGLDQFAIPDELLINNQTSN